MYEGVLVDSSMSSYFCVFNLRFRPDFDVDTCPVAAGVAGKGASTSMPYNSLAYLTAFASEPFPSPPHPPATWIKGIDILDENVDTSGLVTGQRRWDR